MNDPISISSSDSEIDYECDLVEIEHDAISTYARAQGYGEHFGDVFSPQSATSRMTKPLNHVHTLHIEYPQDQCSDAGYQSSTSQRKLPRLESLACPFLPSGSQDFKPFAGPRSQFIGNGDSKPFAGPRSQFISSGEFISSGDSKPFAGPRSQFIGSGDSKPFAGHRSQFTGSEDSKPFAGPRSQFTSSGDSKPFAGPRSQFTGRGDSKTFAGPRSQFTGSGDSKPFARPRSQFTGSGDSEPFAGPRSQFTGSVDSEPFAGPRSQFTGNGDSEPFAGPRSQFTGSGDSEPFAGPRSHFYGSGDSKPFPGPGSQFNGSGNSYPFAGPSSQFNGNGSSYSFAGLSSQFNANENSYPFAGPSSQFSGNGNSYPFAGPSSQFNGNGNSYPFPGPNSLNDKNHEKHTFEQDFMRSTPFPFGRSGSSADPVDPVRNGDEKLGGTDERSVFQQVIQDLHQPKQEAELPDGLLSVPLLRHQKIALAWMRQKEARPLCVGGMLADDQGLGKTISTIALIQMERYSEQKSKSKDHKNHKTVALTLDGNDDKGIISLDDVKPAKDLRAVKFISKGNHKTSALNLDDEDDDDDDQKGFVNLDEIKPEKDLNDVKFISKRNSSRQSSFKQRPAAGTLVVCPATVLRQWARELQDKVTEEAKLKVLIYHGSNRTKDPSELASYDVVLTTYALVANEVPKQPLVDEDDNGESRENNAEKSQGAKRKKKQSKTKKSKKGLDSFFVSEGGTLAKVRWLRVVLDEAQTIKNHRTQAARACCGLRAKKRWCLSGTPMQNTIDELFSYFRFLKYDPYSSYKAFREGIKIPISKNANSGYKKLQVVLRTVMLRRTKGTIVDGKPILSLPPKHINMNRLDLTSEERAFYTDLEHDSRLQFKAYDDAGTVNQNYANILVLLLRLRQACDHPYLCEAAKDFVRRIDSIKTLRQLPRATVNSLHNRLQGSVICRSCEDTPEEAIVTICGHIFCVQCMLDHLSSDENTCPATNCKEKLSKKVIFTKATFRCFVEPNGSEISSSRSNCNQHGEKMLSVSSSEYISSKIKTALEILQSLGKPSVDCIDLDGPAEDDAPKSDALVTVKTEIIDNRSTEERKKAIVFSQWTGMLDLMEASLIRHGIQYRRLDGTMNLAARDDAVREFNSDPQVDVMLMSLKAGNLGLNMVAACHVILLDLWWNPTTEDQAIDRAHRIGQTRAVTVSRLTVKDSVEDRILALQEKKRKIVASAYGEENAGGSSRLSVQDLRFLFMGA